MVKLDFKKAEEAAINANICWIIEKAREFQKILTSASLIMLKPLIVWITTNCGKLFKRWEYQTPYLPPARLVCRSRSSSENQTWNNRLVPN